MWGDNAVRQRGASGAQQYTLEYINYLKDLLLKKPSNAQYLSRKDFEQLAATSQEELDLLKEYHEIKYLGGTSVGGYVGTTPEERRQRAEESQKRLGEIKSRVKHMLEAGERGISETFWTEGGAGYYPEETAEPTAPMTGGDWTYWGPGAIGGDYSPAAGPNYMPLSIPQASAPQTPVSQTPVSQTSTLPAAGVYQDWMGEPPVSNTDTYSPTLMGVGEPFVEGSGPPPSQGTWNEAYQNAIQSGLSPEEALKIANQSLSQYYWGEAAVTPPDLTMELPEDFDVDQYLMPGKGEGIPSIPSPDTWPEGFIPVWDSNWMTYVWEYNPEITTEEDKVSAWQQAQLDLAYAQMEEEEKYRQQQLKLQGQAPQWRTGELQLEQQAQQWGQQYQQQQLALQQQVAERDYELAQRQQALNEQEFVWRQQQAGQLTPYQEEQLAFAREQLATEYQWNQQQLAWQQEQFGQQLEWEREQSAQQYGLSQQELALQEQIAQWNQQYQQGLLAEQQRQYAAQLASQPISWLQHASYTGQTPVVQPWMKPLMSQEYEVGEKIPGWSTQNMSGIPSLTTPSAQYLARMGPTGQQQLYGYEQARTGAPPEETQWRYWQGAPPSGRSTVQYAR